LDYIRINAKNDGSKIFWTCCDDKKVVPLLITKRGSCVINICSIGRYLATSGMASSCSSKFALEAFSDCHRREMGIWVYMLV
jgi:NADP-dependent 3-hydroxy acid dehydrogenase YdfG